MNFNDLSLVVPWIIAHGYLIFLIVATIEGPITTIAAGVVVSLGYFNLWLVLALAVVADVGGDVIYYWFGYSIHRFTRLPFFKYLGLNSQKIEKIRNLLHQHTRRAILLVKISPFIGPLGIILIGTLRLKFKRFFKVALEIGLPKSFFFVFLGYYSGQSYLELNKVIAQSQYIIIGIIIFLLVIYWTYLKIMSKISKELLKKG